jgi:DNA topoisomerase-1
MYQADLQSTNAQKRQLATALSFIDYLSIRVGNTKNEDQADTQGATTLLVKNVILESNYYAQLNFIGKDSLVYKRRIQLTPQIYKNLQEFQKGKKPDDLLFESINAADLNTYLKNMMPELTSKVWRTHNASKLFQYELLKNPTIEGFKQANTKVAEMCNHMANGKLNLSTSLQNYIDPRIITSFAKKYNFDLDQLVSKSLAEKYEWAIKVNNYVF